MDKVKIAKELLKMADDLFEVDEYQETEHNKIQKLLTQYGKKYQSDTVTLEIKFAEDLIDKLDYDNLKAANLDKIVINLNLAHDVDYSVDKLIENLNDANKQAKEIKKAIKQWFNKEIDIKLNYN